MRQHKIIIKKRFSKIKIDNVKDISFYMSNSTIMIIYFLLLQMVANENGINLKKYSE